MRLRNPGGRELSPTTAPYRPPQPCTVRPLTSTVGPSAWYGSSAMPRRQRARRPAEPSPLDTTSQGSSRPVKGSWAGGRAGGWRDGWRGGWRVLTLCRTRAWGQTP